MEASCTSDRSREGQAPIFASSVAGRTKYERWYGKDLAQNVNLLFGKKRGITFWLQDFHSMGSLFGNTLANSGCFTSNLSKFFI